MALKVVWTEPAAQELNDIAAFIAIDSPHYAQVVEDRIHEAADSLVHFPDETASCLNLTVKTSVRYSSMIIE
ncbi:MAG: type II toxin-antitoxin system RelE/ParE family toxin [Calditrichaeota bacterium]|nr:type II toxin-antitoxin system RelE/ParE family toxin [Calditrichota bacterium]